MRPGRRTRELSQGALALALAVVLAGVPAAGTAHAQASADTAPDAQASEASMEAPAAAPDPNPAPDPDPDPDPNPDPGPDAATDSATAAEAPPPRPGPSREALLEAAIAEAERDQPSVLWPWLATGLGVTTLVAGTVVGVINVATCDGSCSTGAVWPWMVIAGCTFTSAGSAWLIIALHDQSEARHRLERARRELERDRIDRAPRAATTPSFTLRASF